VSLLFCATAARHQSDGLRFQLARTIRYAQNFLPRSVIGRPLEGDVPTIDLVIGYSNANTSPILKFLLSKSNDLIARVAQKVR
jgi:LysR family hca operon transcriptional activator